MRLADVLPEWERLELLIARGGAQVRAHALAQIPVLGMTVPLQAIQLGTSARDAPQLIIVGGVHGLERIGTQVVLAYLESLLARLEWDHSLHQLLDQVSLWFLPLINPAGMAMNRRSNGRGVDLMRNAPIDADERASFLVGGQQLTSRLPWFRGDRNAMEPEAQALCDFILNQLNAPVTLVLDCHSGFGAHDRIWFPYASSALRAIDHLGEVFRLRQMLFRSYPNHDYLFEPQALHYRCHGDLWDYLYQKAVARHAILLPLTLEMGSWRWVRKDPLQLRRALGLFHPMRPHRVQRVLRRHLLLFDFLLRATAASGDWLFRSDHGALRHQALALWYGER